MEQFAEFVGNHWILSGLWVGLVVAFIMHQRMTGSKAVSTQGAVMLINRSDALVLDIRDKKDYEAGHVVDSVNIPAMKLKDRVTELEKHRQRPIIVVCKMGQASGEACKTLANAGFTHVVRLTGGMAEWRAQNLPLVQKESMSNAPKPAKKSRQKGKRKGSQNRSEKKAAPQLTHDSEQSAGPVDESVAERLDESLDENLDESLDDNQEENPDHSEQSDNADDETDDKVGHDYKP